MSDNPQSEKSQDGVNAMRERIEAELAALGEAGLDDSRDPSSSSLPAMEDPAFEFALQQPDLSDHAGLGLDADVATVATLAGWADEENYGTLDDELSELAMHRVWRTIERRAPAATEPATHEQANDGSRRGWGIAVVGLGIAAALLLIPVLVPSGPSTPQDDPAQTASREQLREDLDLLSEQAKQGLDALPGPKGTARVESMAQDYAARLASTRGRG